ncbi:MAG: ATP-binding protein [Peptoniphilaceae bacterium]|nr:ATP-binding protein [Peptoniphilaceae bacterium]MDD7383077.1 ATP-binding protein [Peptoniphilaceae bacterium]MDY3737513.1 ATP-binding protein [Peptoniphilaceae bacterium]
MTYVHRDLIKSKLSIIKKSVEKMVNDINNVIEDTDLFFDVKLILNELVINSFEHGNKKDENKIIDVTLIVDRDSAIIKVKDEGEGIRENVETDDLKDSGRGLKLVYALSDEVLIRDSKITVMIGNISSKNKKFL